MAYVRIRPRRSTRDEWEYYNPILAEGEMGIEVPDTGVGTGTIKVKIGDGVTRWKDLPYAINLENIEDSIEKILKNKTVLAEDENTVETSEIILDPTNPGGSIDTPSGGDTDTPSGGDTDNPSGGDTEEPGTGDPGTGDPGTGEDPPTEPTETYTYEKIEMIEISLDNTISLFKLTPSAVYADITEVSDPFYRTNPGGSFVIAEGVTADSFAELVETGLWVRSEYAYRFYPDVTAIYVKESDGTYREVTIPTDESGGTTPFIDTITTTSGDKYIRVTSS